MDGMRAFVHYSLSALRNRAVCGVTERYSRDVSGWTVLLACYCLIDVHLNAVTPIQKLDNEPLQHSCCNLLFLNGKRANSLVT